MPIQGVTTFRYRLKEVTYLPSQRVYRTSIAAHERVINELHKVPGIRLKMEELHDVPQKVLKVSSIIESLLEPSKRAFFESLEVFFELHAIVVCFACSNFERLHANSSHLEKKRLTA